MSKPRNTYERLAVEHVEANGCPVCELPERKLAEVDIYNGLPNDAVADRYRIGDNPKFGGELVRQHRLLGHMTPRADFAGVALVTLREEAEAIRAERAEVNS